MTKSPFNWPRGIYAKVDISSYIAQFKMTTPPPTSEQHWDQANPNPPPAANAYDWGYVDGAFAIVADWNAQNPTKAPKTVQLILTPGFQTPQLVFEQINPCDGLFEPDTPTPPSTCGKVNFTGFVEPADGTEFPLPWNPFYKSAWGTFLTVVAATYGSNPALVSIAVAGPTAASEEMIVPNDTNGDNPQVFGTNKITPNAMWIKLLMLAYQGMSAYQGTDLAFIVEWAEAIDMYGSLFSGVTLVATTGNGLPNFSTTGCLDGGLQCSRRHGLRRRDHHSVLLCGCRRRWG